LKVIIEYAVVVTAFWGVTLGIKGDNMLRNTILKLSSFKLPSLPPMMTSFFSDAHHCSVEQLNVNQIVSPSILSTVRNARI
jgi:hypothetical protein